MTRVALQRRGQTAEDLMQRAGESIVFQRQMIATLARHRCAGGHATAGITLALTLVITDRCP